MDPNTQPTSPGPRRARAGSRSFSLHSDKSGGANHTPSVQERNEKERRDSFLRGESKANPNAAMLELDPQMRNVAEKVTLDSIRDVEAKDNAGNVISEPDLSNPTRPRWERPLDTIRSFEKAIDGDYSRRSQARSYSDQDAQPSRRSSYYGNQHNRYQGGGHYDRRSDNHYNDGNGPAHRQRYGRGVSEGSMARGSSGHYGPPAHGGPGGQHYNLQNGNYDQSSGSEGTAPWANSTDPSSQNSSYERLAAMGKPGQSPEHNTIGDRVGGAYAIDEEGDNYGYPPRPPPKASYGAPSAPSPHDSPRQPIKLGNSTGVVSDDFAKPGGQLPTNTRPAAAEKRKSWIGRRFSKSER